MKNKPFTHEEVSSLKAGQILVNEYPSRRMKKYNRVPKSTKLGKGSMNNSNVFRTNKYKKHEN